MNDYFLRILIRERQREFLKIVRRGNQMARQQKMVSEAERKGRYALRSDKGHANSDRKNKQGG